MQAPLSNPYPAQRPYRATAEFVLSKYEADPNSGCWLYVGVVDRDGYGSVGYRRRTHRVHRLAYALLVGPIPEGMIVCHRCDTPSCFNPAHLFLGTDKDNSDDRERKGRGNQRSPRGSQASAAKLTEETAAAVWRDTRLTRVIAEAYGLHVSAVRQIKQGRTWRHITKDLGPAGVNPRSVNCSASASRAWAARRTSPAQ